MVTVAELQSTAPEHALVNLEHLASDSHFWRSVGTTVKAAILPVFARFYLAGMQAGIRKAKPLLAKRKDMSQEELDILISDPEVAATLRMRLAADSDAWWSGLERTTKNELFNTLEIARRDGLTMRDIVGRVEKLFGSSRAETIAVTECLPAETLVDGAVVRAAFRRWYEGQMVEVSTRGGRSFSATPNHPVLTRRGWLGAGEITEADYLICYLGKEGLRRPRYPDIEAPPAAISEVFGALSAIGLSERIAGTEPDFHGDGRQGQVDVLAADRALRFGSFVPLYEPVIKDVLAPSRVVGATFCDRCRVLFPITQHECFCGVAEMNAGDAQPARHQRSANMESRRYVSDRFAASISLQDVGRRDIAPVMVGALADHETVRLAPSPYGTRFLKNRVDDIGADLHQFGDAGSRFTTPIELDNVVAVTRKWFVGHVYNLSTPHGYFSIERGIVSGNTTRLFGAGQQASYDALGIERWNWETAQDDRVDETCDNLSTGGPYPMSEPFTPAHVGCRCWPSPAV